MLTHNIALLSQTSKVSLSDLLPVAAALQKQLSRDFAPIWKRSGTVSAFADLKQVPMGFWPVIIRDDIGEPGAAGYHADKHHQPYSLVDYGENWPVTASHEVLEMDADPYGNRLRAGNHGALGRVLYLLEVADPPEAYT